MATKKISKAPADQKAKRPGLREKLRVKTRIKDDDWYEAAFKRFSISLNRANQHRDPLAALMPPTKSGLQ